MTPRLPILSLRRWILWPLIGALLLSALPVALFTQDAADSAAIALGRTYVLGVGDRIADHLDSELSVLPRIVETNAAAFAQGRLTLDDPLAAAPWLVDQLRQYPHLTVLSVATAEGRYVAAARAPERRDAVNLAINFLDRPMWLQARVVERDGRPGPVVEGEVQSPYDPRERDFMQQAIAARGPVWGEIRSFVGWRSFGVGFSAPVIDSKGSIAGVVGANMALERLGQLLSELRLPEGGVVFVTDASGRMISSSTPGALYAETAGGLDRLALARFAHPIAAPMGALLGTGNAEGVTSLASASERYVVDLRRVTAASGLDWWVGVAVPERYFIAPLQLSRERLFLVIVGILLVAGAFGMILSRAVAGPVERLGAAAARGQLAELARRESLDSPVREVGRLSSALGDLADALRESIDALEARVAERTAELEDANAQLLALSLRDPLTGVGNRRSFDEALVREWSGAVRRRQPLALLLVDVDHFKQLNDRHGHLVGDEVLKAIATAIGGVVRRATDLLARYGGEEFVVLMPDTGPEEALALAERVRAAMGADAVSALAGRVTVSIGAAVARPTPSDAPSALLAAADAALYRAKSAGRDRVEPAFSTPL